MFFKQVMSLTYSSSYIDSDPTTESHALIHKASVRFGSSLLLLSWTPLRRMSQALICQIAPALDTDEEHFG